MTTYNITDLELHRARERYMASLGMSMDAKRPNAWYVFGYTEAPSFAQLRNAYSRHGAAHGAVHRLLDGCWGSVPRVRVDGKERASAFERDFEALMERVNGWAILREVDRRTMIGRFAAVVYRVADNLPLDQPLGRARELVELVPVWESDITVAEWDKDKASPTYGKPTMYSVQVGEVDGRPAGAQKVHASRVQLLAEGAVGEDYANGAPLLMAGFNALCDLEKITGGSAESYLKNSARTLNFSYRTGESPEPISGEGGQQVSVADAHEAQARRINSSVDAAIVTAGADVSTLQTQVADPRGAFEVAAGQFAAAVRIPYTILFGQQTGRLASDEDRADFAARIKSRQETTLTPLLRAFVGRMQAAGILPQSRIVIEWQDSSAQTDAQRMENAARMVAMAADAMQAGIGELFTRDEIRRALGYESMSGEGGDLTEGGDEGDADGDDPADATA